MARAIPRIGRAYPRPWPLTWLQRRSRPRGLLITGDAAPPFVETFHLLALNLQALLAERPSRAVLVASAYPQEGRSLVAANLAVAMTGLYPQVLLIDGDGRRPGLLELLGPGESADQAGALPWEAAGLSRPTEVPGLWLLPRQRREVIAAAIAQAPAEGVALVVDSPPCLTSSEPFYLAPLVGGVLYVIRRRGQDIAPHQQVRAQMDRLGARLLGTLLNEG